MLATIAALHLAVLSQVAAPREVRPEDGIVEEAGAGASEAEPSDVAEAQQEAAPPAEGGAPAGETKPAEPSLPERQAAVVPPKPAHPHQLSLLAAEPLDGGSASLGWLGWSSLGIMYGQGITGRDDLAASLDFDWSKTELRLGAFYRRSIGMAGPFDMAARLAVAWYADFGGHWIHEENHSDRGVEFTPGLSLSRWGAGGIFSGIVDAPITITTRQGAGLLFSPRFTFAYETLLYQDVSVGARVGLGYRAGSGDAPLTEGRAELTFLVVATYQLF